MGSSKTRKAKAKAEARDRARASDKPTVVTPLNLTLKVILALKDRGKQAKERARDKACAGTSRSMGNAGGRTADGSPAMAEAW